MKKYKISGKITITLLIVASLTACGSVNETSVNDSSSSETSEAVTQISETTETSVSSELKTETTTTLKADSYTTYEPKAVNVSEPTEEINETTESSSESEKENVNQDSDYKTAYIDIIESLDDEECEYNLIYFDDDDIPELVVGKNEYYISMYTFSDGEIYNLIDHWGYGAMGNSGYEYVPRKNSLRNKDSDYAGLIVYTTYMEIGKNHSLDTVAEIETFNFDDSNGNGIPDDDEMDSAEKYTKSFINGSEISEEDIEKYNVGDYELISVSMTLDELKSALS